MIKNLIDTLDLALERLQAGEPISTILADYPAEAEQLGPLLEAAATLDHVAPVEMPAPAKFQTDRAGFLAEVTSLQQQAISPGLVGRLKEGIVHSLPWFTLGEAYSEGRQKRMSTVAIKIMLVFGLLFGSTGATAAMAANSLPDSRLYPVKLALEDARLAVTANPAQQAQLHLAMARERTQEMTQQALNGDVPGEPTLQRLQYHLNYALQLSGQLPDEQMAGVLTQAQEMAQTQTQHMAHVQTQVGAPAQGPLRHAYQLLEQAKGEAEGGLEDPLAFRNRFGRNRPDDAPVQPSPEPDSGQESDPAAEPLPLEGAEPVPAQNPDVQQDCSPDCPEDDGAQNQHHGRESDTLPGNVYGEPQPCDTPGECGDQNQYGQDPELEPGEHGHLYGQENNEADGPNGPPEDAGCGDDCGSAGNQNQEQVQDQEPQQTGPNGNNDNGQDAPLIDPGGSSAGGGSGGNNSSSGSDNSSSDSGGSDSSGDGAKNGGGGKKN